MTTSESRPKHLRLYVPTKFYDWDALGWLREPPYDWKNEELATEPSHRDNNKA